MTRFLVGRLVHSIFVLIGVSVLVFVLLYAGGDPARAMLPPDASAEQVEQYRQVLGLDQPLHIQYLRFVGRALQGDFGLSFRGNQPAMELVLERFPASLWLTFASLVFAVIVAFPLGIITALRKDSWLDTGGSILALIWQAAPNFWLGIVLILIFAEYLRWLPPIGAGGPEHLVLPGVTLGAFTAAVLMRLLRSSLIEVLSSDYIRSAKGKGLSIFVIVMRHALKNASIPVVTVMGLQVGTLLGGAIITEQVFAYPGMGRLALSAIAARDIPVVMAFVIFIAVFIIIINLIVDFLYTLLDPRIRYTD